MSPATQTKTPPVHGGKNQCEPGKEGLGRAIDLITLLPSQVIINGTRFFHDDAFIDGNRQLRRQRGKSPWGGRWAIDRALLQMKHPTTQKELAHLIGISPRAVSQGLADHPYVQRNDDGCYIEHTDATIDRWIDDYPGPGEATLYWYSLDAIVEQGHNVATLADELEVQALLSDDVAADDYAPWRLPATAIIYLREAVDFTVIDFMPTTRENATLIAKIPEDPTVWALGRTLTENPQRMLADPMPTLWDVTHSTGSDTDDAAEGLDYRVVGGHMIQLLLHAYPQPEPHKSARATADADAGIERSLAIGQDIHHRLLERGYTPRGNRYEKNAADSSPDVLAVDLLVPQASTERTAILGERAFDAIPGLTWPWQPNRR